MSEETLESHVGSFVNVFNERMSLYGMLRKTGTKGKYRVDMFRSDGYYIFEVSEVQAIVTQNSILIALKG